jgi:exodeoxyribonuclease-3
MKTIRSERCSPRYGCRRISNATQTSYESEEWTDAVREPHPGERIYTFWDYFRNAWSRDAGLRIDHLLISPSVADRLRGAGVDREIRG